jgi:hypothetical protein
MDGKKVLSRNIDSPDYGVLKSLSIPVKNLAQGIYTIKVISGGSEYTSRVAIVK